MMTPSPADFALKAKEKLEREEELSKQISELEKKVDAKPKTQKKPAKKKPSKKVEKPAAKKKEYVRPDRLTVKPLANHPGLQALSAKLSK